MSAAPVESCFHCGEPVPARARFSATIGGQRRPMCCAGCAAVAQTIADSGLAAYYTTRSAPARRESEDVVAVDLEVYDLPEVQKPFVRSLAGGMMEATLQADGITCGACVWLIENALMRCEGVREVAVNLAARRVHVKWDGARTRLSTILRTLEALGYRARGFDAFASESATARERRRMIWRLFVAGLAMMQVMMYAVPVYLAAGDMSADVEQLMRWAGLVLTVPVMLFSAGPFFVNAWRELRSARVGMDTPVALGIAVAFAASAWATFARSGEVYFDSIAMFVFLLLGARYLEGTALARSEELRLRLMRSTPAIAERILPGEPAATEKVPVARLAPGDRVLVPPGGLIPADGRVEHGRSSADESLLTGESRPVAKIPDDLVVGGSVNLVSPLTVQVTRVGADSVLNGIVRLMDRALTDRPRIALVADRVARWFVAALLAVAAVTGIAWYWIEPARALWVVVAVLVVSCPCALSLATPAALAAATGSLYRLGLLVTRGRALEALAQATHVILDKTGTLTTGRLSLSDVIPLGSLDGDGCITLADALERGSEHPIAAPIAYAATRLPRVEAQAIRNYPGCGVEGVVNGRRVRLGSPAFAAEITRREPPAELLFAKDEAIAIVLADEGGYLGILTLGDTLRPGARLLVQELKTRGKTVCILSGDRARTVDYVSRALEIDLRIAEAGPQRKLAFVKELQAAGAVVAMIGDGINDAPVLAQAQVSIAMGGGTDLAQASADMVLLGDNLAALPAAFDVARRTMRVIRQNLSWAIAYNACAIPAAAFGWITPLAAGIGMAVSSLVVVGNALRLARPTASGGVEAGTPVVLASRGS